MTHENNTPNFEEKPDTKVLHIAIGELATEAQQVEVHVVQPDEEAPALPTRQRK